MGGVYTCIETLSENDEVGDKAVIELVEYKMAEGFFGRKQAIRSRTTMSPGK